MSTTIDSMRALARALAGAASLVLASTVWAQSPPLGPPLMLHGALEFGYHIGDQHSVSLSIDEGRGPDLHGGIESTDNLHLRYGLKF